MLDPVPRTGYFRGRLRRNDGLFPCNCTSLFKRLWGQALILGPRREAVRAALLPGQVHITRIALLMNYSLSLNADLIDAEYQKWKSHPESVSREWRIFFEGFELA